MASLDSLSKNELLKLINQVATISQYEMKCEEFIRDAHSEVESLQSKKRFHKPGRITIIGIFIYLVLANAIGMGISFFVFRKVEYLYACDIIAFVAILIIRKLIVNAAYKKAAMNSDANNQMIAEQQMEILDECENMKKKMDEYNDLIDEFYNEYNIQKELRNKQAIIALSKYFKSYPNAGLHQAVNAVLEQSHRERMETMERERMRAVNEAMELNQKIYDENRAYYKESLRKQDEANRATERANAQRQVIVDDINAKRWKG